MSKADPDPRSVTEPETLDGDVTEQQRLAAEGFAQQMASANQAHQRQAPSGGLDTYEEELERTKSQLLIFARDIAAMYQRERRAGKQLSKFDDEVKADYLSIIQTLALVVEAKDQYTRHHLDRCRDFGTALARAIDPAMVTPEVQYGFLLHDVGKIGIPEAILLKTSSLTPQERVIIERHPLIGVQLVEPMSRILGRKTLEVIRHHHERFDGEGYPDGLAGQQIPLSARIFTVVDSYDAMTTDRPYRRALPAAEALSRLQQGAGSQFDPEVVEAWKGIVDSHDGGLNRPGG